MKYFKSQSAAFHPVKLPCRGWILLFCGLAFSVCGFAADLEALVAGLQQRYASVDTVKADFLQTYHAPGIEQIESGTLWMKKPGLMRWEYRDPETKLFVADGHESYVYVPEDRQVTVQAFSASDMHSTPLEFLLGSGDIKKSFNVSLESEFKPKASGTLLLRLEPFNPVSEYSFFVLEVNENTYDLSRIVIHEPGGSTSEFLITNLETNVQVDDERFRFKIPKGVEVIRFNANE